MTVVVSLSLTWFYSFGAIARQLLCDRTLLDCLYVE